MNSESQTGASRWSPAADERRDSSMTAEVLDNKEEPTGTPAFIFRQTAPGPTQPWSWAENLLKSAATYWLVTTSPDGHPHSRPLWGIWEQDTFWFSSQNRSGEFLKANPRASVNLQVGEDVVMIEGSCSRVLGNDDINVLAEGVGVKYDWELTVSEDRVHTRFGQSAPVFRLNPERVYGWAGIAGWESATRWDFPRS
ncbi:pyridoxamine 5'-phosphate oxidase family protein [Streptomyces sp. STCH 565 A]|uniref:pyridoxamine 5'-phosphate oxidase family protein n=1 Tax=Streptomyces sp. STCH 565 A TaxID=2950532 RepID=UPI0020754051|nr:pyridoxamine 5'-phosphate oxidase family protein [Streptomyces sp. STCH 565 A]MCM8549553.1 pyridoxamine 5'-phosphate oxidase family protein [Streptomyces sp. STCH 565 A]